MPALRVAELTDIAAGFHPESIGPVIKPLCAELGRRLQLSPLQPTGPLLAYYEQSDGVGDQVVVHAAIPVTGDQRAEDGLPVLELPGCEQAATIVHRGSMDNVLGHPGGTGPVDRGQRLRRCRRAARAVPGMPG